MARRASVRDSEPPRSDDDLTSDTLVTVLHHTGVGWGMGARWAEERDDGWYLW